MGNEVVIGSCDKPLYNRETQKRGASRLYFGLCLLELPFIASHITFKDNYKVGPVDSHAHVRVVGY